MTQGMPVPGARIPRMPVLRIQEFEISLTEISDDLGARIEL